MNISTMTLLSLLTMIPDTLEITYYLLIFGHSILLTKVIYPILSDTRSLITEADGHIPFSVIVCAHNELQNLKRLVPKLLEQNHSEYEIIIALDRCTDGSEEFIRSFENQKIQTLVISSTPQNFSGKKNALTHAIRHAKYEWLLFTDADCIPQSQNWINTFSASVTPKTDLILGLSPYVTQPTLVSAFTAYETFQTAIHYASAALQGEAYMGVGRNISYRKQVFLTNNGFYPYESVVGGDDDLMVQKLSTAQNTVMNIHKESLTYSAPKRTWSEYITQKTRHLSVGRHYQSNFQAAHMIRVIIHAFLWLSFLYLIYRFTVPARIIVVFSTLVVLKGYFFKKISNRTGLPFRWYSFPIGDFVYAIFLPLIGIRALVERNIKWK